MRQGEAKRVMARLSRGADTKITEGLDTGSFVIENTKVSCMVSMRLESQEHDAFKIEDTLQPGGTPKLLLRDSHVDWNWFVTPRKSGTLHLLLYVSPMLYVEGVGQALTEIPQKPRLITVSPDYWYTAWQTIVDNWPIWSVLLTAVAIPLFLWFIGKLPRKRSRRVGFQPVSRA